MQLFERALEGKRPSYKTQRRGSTMELPPSIHPSGVHEHEHGASALFKTDKDQILGHYSPLKCVLVLSIGPLVSQLVNSLTGVVNSLYVAKAIGDRGVEVFGAVFVVEFIAIAVSQYLNASVSVRVSYLFGQQKPQECAQLYADFVRLCFVFGVLVPAVILPIVKPVVHWFGADTDLSAMAYEYMLAPTLGCSMNFLFMIGCGLIQAEGQSIKYGIIQLCVFITSLGLFTPLFLFVFKTSIWGASFSIILAQSIPAIIMNISIFRGKHSIKPTLKMLTHKFTPETFSALRVGFSTFLENVSLNIPLVLMQKYINLAAEAVGLYNSVIRIWAIVEKFSLLVSGICVGFSQGMMPGASYAYGAGRFNRLMWEGFHALWLSMVISVAISIIVIIWPRQISSFWSKDPEFLDLAERMVPIYFYTASLLGIQYVVPAILPAMKRVLMSVTLSILTLLLPIPMFSSILYFTHKTDPVRLMYTYTINDVYSVIIDVLYMIKPMKILMKSEPSGKAESANIDRIGGIDVSDVEEDEVFEI